MKQSIKTVNPPETPPKKGFKIQFDEEQTATEQAIKAFNIDDFLVDPDKIEEKAIPNIGVVRFKRLTADEIREFANIPDSFEVGMRMLTKMLSKADPSITYEKIKQMDVIVTSRILQEVVGPQTRFLSTPKQPQRK